MPEPQVRATDELAALDATATAAAVRAGELHPTEAVAAAIARAEALDPALGAIALADHERALAAAADQPTDGPFAGVPTYVKDNADVAGLPTRQGSAALRDAAPAARTSVVAAQLLDMGVACLGKSALPEFGFTSSNEEPGGPPTRNPWNPGHTAGGSSSGAAALVAAGVVPIAHGADGGGSIRIPAACCGLVGLKPSRGRLVPGPDARLLPVPIVTEGVLTRTVRDSALYLAEAERRWRNLRLPPVGRVTIGPGRALRIGVLAESPAAGPCDAPTLATLERAVDVLEGLGHRAEPVEVADAESFAEDFVHYWAMLAAAVTTGGARLYDPSFDRDALSPVTVGLAERFRADVRRTPGVIRRLRRTAARHAAVFSAVDVVVSPVLTTVAPPIGHLDPGLPFDEHLARLRAWVGFTPLANAAGHPSISLPLGHDDATGLPVGVMCSAEVGADRLLLQLALQLERAGAFVTASPGRGAAAG